MPYREWHITYIYVALMEAYHVRVCVCVYIYIHTHTHIHTHFIWSGTLYIWHLWRHILYMPYMERDIVSTQWMTGIISYYRIGCVINHVVDPEIYQFSNMHSTLQHAVQSPLRMFCSMLNHLDHEDFKIIWWIKKMSHIYTMEYYSAIKRNEIYL